MLKKKIESVNEFYESMICHNDDNAFDYSDYSDSDESEEPDYPDYLDFLNNPNYEIVYEKHGWRFIKDFFSELSPLMKDKIMLWYSFLAPVRVITSPLSIQLLVCCCAKTHGIRRIKGRCAAMSRIPATVRIIFGF